MRLTPVAARQVLRNAVREKPVALRKEVRKELPLCFSFSGGSSALDSLRKDDDDDDLKAQSPSWLLVVRSARVGDATETEGAKAETPNGAKVVSDSSNINSVVTTVIFKDILDSIFIVVSLRSS